jgi:hypothetical protein
LDQLLDFCAGGAVLINRLVVVVVVGILWTMRRGAATLLGAPRRAALDAGRNMEREGK